jgi:hypothetical protein
MIETDEKKGIHGHPIVHGLHMASVLKNSLTKSI